MSEVREQARRFPLVGGVAAGAASLSIALIVLFTFLTALAAAVRIPLPFTPVPITLQVLAVLLAGAVLGPVRGAISQVLYLAWGASGLPMFAGGLGLAVIAGPTGGYIIGFVPAAMLAGWIVPRAGKTWEVCAGFLLASMVILLAGYLHMTIFYTHNPYTSLVLGVMPFIAGDLIKVTLATGIYAGIRKGLKRL